MKEKKDKYNKHIATISGKKCDTVTEDDVERCRLVDKSVNEIACEGISSDKCSEYTSTTTAKKCNTVTIEDVEKCGLVDKTDADLFREKDATNYNLFSPY